MAARPGPTGGDLVADRQPAGPDGRPGPDMVWIPGGTFLMGSDRPLSGGGAGPPGHGRWLLDRPPHRHQRRVRPLRCQDRLCDRGRAAPRPGRLPRRQARAADPSVHRVPPATPPGRPWQPLQLVDLCARRELAPPPRTRQLGEEAAGPSGGARRLGRRRGLRGLGRARNCRPRPSGSSPPAAAWTAPPMPGARNSRPRGAGWPTPGRASSRSRTPSRTATRAPRR